MVLWHVLKTEQHYAMQERKTSKRLETGEAFTTAPATCQLLYMDTKQRFTAGHPTDRGKNNFLAPTGKGEKVRK